MTNSLPVEVEVASQNVRPLCCQEKVRSFEEVPAYAVYFFTDDFPVIEKARRRIFRKGEPIDRLAELLPILEAADSFTEEALEEAVHALAQRNERYTGDYIHPARLAVSGTHAGPGFYALLHVLGKERTLRRVNRFIRNHAVDGRKHTQ